MSLLIDKDLQKQAKTIFGQATFESISRGRPSRFSRALSDFIKEHGDEAVQAIALFVRDKEVKRDLRGEALLWIGALKDAHTGQARLELLGSMLHEEDIVVRGDAITGLELLEDPACVGHFQVALKKENVPEYKVTMQNAIREWSE